MNYKDDITGAEIPVSNKSTQTIVRALVSAYRAGDITAHEYAMTYAEVCEPGVLPQVFGGRSVYKHLMDEWQYAKGWTLIDHHYN